MGETTGIQWTDSSWNPWAGCTMISPGCANCLAPETLVLHADMGWRPIGSVVPGDELVGFDETAEPGRTRKIRRTTVEAVRWSRRETTRLVTGATEVRTTAEHRWLAHHAANWPATRRLRVGLAGLRQVGCAPSPADSADYRAGYIAGMTKGDGTMRYEPGAPNLPTRGLYWRVALADHEPLGRLVAYLAMFGVGASVRPFNPGPAALATMQKVEVRAKGSLGVIHSLREERGGTEWRRGFVAGFFDAEGSNDKNLRLSQKNVETLRMVQGYAAALGFRFELETFSDHCPTLRLEGALRERIRFLGLVRPAITRKTDDAWGRTLYAECDRVVAVEPSGVGDVVDIQTSSGTFFAQGLATHNCYMFSEQRRYGRDPAVVRRTKTWGDPPKWQRAAAAEGVTRRVFTCSWSDWFHEAADPWRDQAWALLKACPNLIFQILTKRHERIADHLPADWGAGYPNVWLGVSVEDCKHGLPRIDALREVPAVLRFLSIEPLLQDLGAINLTGIGWVIAGGESGHLARAAHPDWFRSVRDQCDAAGVPFFFKQRGEWSWCEEDGGGHDVPMNWAQSPDRYRCIGRDGKRTTGYDGSGAEFVVKVGKRSAGHLLDGRAHQEFPW